MLEKKGRMPTIIFSVLCAGISMLLVAIAPGPFHWLCFLAAIFAGIGMAGSIVGANTLAMDASPITLMGAVMGGLSTMQPIGILFFLALGGVLYDGISPGAAFALKGIASIALVVWLFTIRNDVTEEIKATFNMDWEEGCKIEDDEDPRRRAPGSHRGYRVLCPGPGPDRGHRCTLPGTQENDG